MSIETSYGFRSAQAAYENATPFDSDCACDPLYVCQRCESYAETEGPCKECEDDAYDEADGPGHCAQVDREDCTFNANSNCPRHGFCTGCTRSTCEDCGGEE